MPEGERPLLSVREAARLLGISKDLVYAMAAEDRLPVIRFGRRVLVHRAKLLRWIDCQVTEPESVSGESVASGSR